MFKVYPHIKALYMSGFKDEDILDIEDYREDFKKVNAIATIYCCCRRLSWGAKDYPQGYVCVCFNRGVEYQVERGSAIMRTPDEMLELEENLCIPHWDMYTASNMTAKQDYICNCGVEVGGCIWGGPIATGELRDAFAPSRYQAVVDPLKCKSCRLCVDNCNVHAINLKQYPDGTAKAWVDPDVCMGCGCCVVNCPNGAREMILVRPPEFIIQRDNMPTGRYDTPEKYIEVADLTAGLKEGRRKRDKEMEDKWCAKHRVNRNPYGIQA
jgi:ferredoxin